MLPIAARLAMILLALVASAALLAACSSQQQKAQQSAERYLQAQASGDWEQFCQLLAPGQEQLLSASLEKDGAARGAECQQALQQAPEAAASLRNLAQGVKIEAVEVDGDQGRVLFRRGDSPFQGQMIMVNSDQGWGIILTPRK